MVPIPDPARDKANKAAPPIIPGTPGRQASPSRQAHQRAARAQPPTIM
jgi:hypothetical protein